jgi:hypothetical protein
MAPIELDVLPAVEPVQPLATIRCRAVLARKDPASLIGVLRTGDAPAKIGDAPLTLRCAGHGLSF